MNNKLLLKFFQSFAGTYKTIPALGIYLVVFAISASAQNPETIIPSSQVKLLKTIKLHSPGGSVEAPAVVDPNAIYSNVNPANLLGGYSNGGATLQAGNTITTLVADSLGLVGTPPFSVGSFVFSIVNNDVADVTARPRIRFYAADGPAGSPGTLITGLTFAPITFTAGSAELFDTGPMQTPITITTQSMWAGITFDDSIGTSGATVEQLNNLGQGIIDPIDRGSSTDDFFQTDTAGSFLADLPAGSFGNFSGDPLANFAWEIVSSIPLPVTLNDFRVQRSGLINTLTWSTSQELNSNYFAVEHSNDGIHFTQIGEVKAGGNSSVARNYRFDDPNPVKGINYYRLRIVNIDNSGQYSDIITVRNTGTITFTIFPNPVRNILLVNMDVEKSETADVSITDINGRKVYSRPVTVTQGNNNFSVDVNNFSKGTYYIKVQLSNGSYTNKFNKL